MSYYLERIQHGVDYIEARLHDDLEIARIAKEAGLSQWHFQRIFKSLTGETLKTYIRSRRFAKALELLSSTQLRVLDIALLSGFESQEAFARAFKKAFGMTAQDYRKLGKRNVFVKKPQFDADYLTHIHHNVSLEPEVRFQKQMNLVGMRTQFFGTDSEKNNIGARLPPLWKAFLDRLPEIDGRVPGVCYGVVRQEQHDSDRLEYHAAVEVTEAAHPPKGMVSFQVPAASYARFEHRGPAQQIDHTVSYAYSTWLAQSEKGYRHTGGPDLEIYGAAYHPTAATSVMHYALPIT
ncbi:MAG TPA: AraC family transcriptional regulator [Polyangiaceae bacterium]|nr:AraC family transcriptional regulator [Polyangiaceae bacterium]